MEKKKDDFDESLKQGAIGGLLGACIGVPGLGIVAGVMNANKDKLKNKFNELNKNDRDRR